MAKKERVTLQELPPFAEADFLAFERYKVADPESNPERLRLKRKLHTIGGAIQARVREAGEDLELRTSIHHPYKFNGNRVDALWLYLAPPDKARKKLRSLLGVEFASDTDASYVHANLVLHIDYTGIKMGLRVHERAWWDTMNMSKRSAEREGAEALAGILNQVDQSYSLTLHDWKREHRCGSIQWDKLLEFFRYFEAGRHRIQVMRSLSKDDPKVLDPTLFTEVAEQFVSLLPLYRFILWSPQNNHLGMGAGG